MMLSSQGSPLIQFLGCSAENNPFLLPWRRQEERENWESESLATSADDKGSSLREDAADSGSRKGMTSTQWCPV